MTEIEDVLVELWESPRDDTASAERAVARLYRFFRMNLPEFFWVDSIEAALQKLTIQRDGDDNSAERITGKLRRAHVAVEHYLSAAAEVDPFGSFEQLAVEHRAVRPPLLQAATLEARLALRTVRHATLDAKQRHRDDIGEAIPGDTLHNPLDHGVNLFRQNWFDGPGDVRLSLLEATHRMNPGLLPKAQRSFLKIMMDLARDTYWVFLTDRCALMASPPIRCRWDDSGLVHCDCGPALEFKDGRQIFALGGACVPPSVVLAPETICLRDIELESEEDTRAAMIERYGLERYLRDSGAILLHSDEYGELYWKAQHLLPPLVAVRVRNSSPGPDGSHSHHVIRVAPHVCTAREAVAWTFGMEEEEYSPVAQT